MYEINYDDADKLWSTVIEVMDETKNLFSIELDKGSCGQSKVFREGCPSWLRFCGELRKRRMGWLLGEIEYLESKMLMGIMERNLYECFNDGDEKGVSLAVKGLSGVAMKAKLTMSKEGQSMVIEGVKDELSKYKTEELEKMIKCIDLDVGEAKKDD